MAKNLMTHHTYYAWAAGLINSTVQIESPRRRMSRILPSNRPLGAYIHGSPPSVEDDLKVRSLKSRIKTHSFLEEIITSSKEVFKDLESDMSVRIRTLVDPTQKPGEGDDTVTQTASS